MLLNDEQQRWCDAHYDEALELIRTLGKIPAPSHHEEKRAAFVKHWLETQGAKNVYIDDALNVVLPINVTDDNAVSVVMAHTDVVFPDTEALEMREDESNIYAPGVGDDTANLVSLMMAAKYFVQNGYTPKDGLLIVANSCEEGLGNLKGSKRILSDFAGRVTEMISLDGNFNEIVNRAVGSHRMRITIHAQGGHSYRVFGNTNAIVQMAELIGALYRKTPPTKAKTTYNIGVIEGGTTVNTICAECSILYEFRSEDVGCLREMESFFNDTIAAYRAKGFDINVEVIGVRPCADGVDANAQNALTRRMKTVMEHYIGHAIEEGSGSTDANSALGIGIPSVTIGATEGHCAHTRDEWMEKSAIPTGMKIALATLMQYS